MSWWVTPAVFIKTHTHTLGFVGGLWTCFPVLLLPKGESLAKGPLCSFQAWWLTYFGKRKRYYSYITAKTSVGWWRKTIIVFHSRYVVKSIHCHFVCGFRVKPAPTLITPVYSVIFQLGRKKVIFFGMDVFLKKKPSPTNAKKMAMKSFFYGYTFLVIW